MTTKNIQVDLELKKAFAELQAKMVDTRQKIKIADLQIEQQRRKKQHAMLTQDEINSLDPDTKTYETVGRMFVLRDIETIQYQLKDRYDKAGEKIKSIESSKTFLERNFKDSENNLRELIQQKKDLI